MTLSRYFGPMEMKGVLQGQQIQGIKRAHLCCVLSYSEAVSCKPTGSVFVFSSEGCSDYYFLCSTQSIGALTHEAAAMILS